MLENGADFLLGYTLLFLLPKVRSGAAIRVARLDYARKSDASKSRFLEHGRVQSLESRFLRKANGGDTEIGVVGIEEDKVGIPLTLLTGPVVNMINVNLHGGHVIPIT
jgi:hypothetical protein